LIDFFSQYWPIVKSGKKYCHVVGRRRQGVKGAGCGPWVWATMELIPTIVEIIIVKMVLDKTILL